MATIMMTCPSTGRPVSTAKAAEWSTFGRLRALTGSVKCPACAQTHELVKERVWLR